VDFLGPGNGARAKWGYLVSSKALDPLGASARARKETQIHFPRRKKTKSGRGSLLQVEKEGLYLKHGGEKEREKGGGEGGELGGKKGKKKDVR